MHGEQQLEPAAAPGPVAPSMTLDELIHSMSPSPAPQPPLHDAPSDPTLMPYSSNGIPQSLPQQSQYAQSRPRSASPDPEPLLRMEIDHMRARALYISDPPNPNSNPTFAEKELATMVLRLTAHLATYPDPAQLATQAETIADLTAQRTFLLRGREEERELWSAERESWDRIAEALLMKSRSTGQKDYESERKLGRLQDDNSSLRQKLTDALDRVHALEAELSRLRPLFLVQPALLSDPSQSPGFFQLLPMKEEKEAERDHKKARRKVKREKAPVEISPEIAAAIPINNHVIGNLRDKDVSTAEREAGTEPASEDADGEADPDVQMTSGAGVHPSMLPFSSATAPSTPPPAHSSIVVTPATNVLVASPDGPSTLARPPATPRASSQPPAASNSLHNNAVEKGDASPRKYSDEKGKSRRHRIRAGIPEQERLAPPLLSDARTECLLAAARKIGKARAAVLAGIVRDHEKEKAREEKEREQEREREREQRQGQAANAYPGTVQQRPIGADWDLRWFQDRSNSFDYRNPYSNTLHTSPTRLTASTSVPGSRRGTPTPRPQLPSHLHPSIQHYPHGALHSHNPPRPTHPHQPGHAGPYPQHPVPLVYMQPPLAVPISHGHPQGHVPLSMPMPVATGSGPVLLPIRPGTAWPMPSTPSRRDGANPAAAGSPGSSAATATPLDSLVSAARSMMDEEGPDDTEDTPNDERRRSLRTSVRSGRKGGQAADPDESPVPKKRKVASTAAPPPPTPATKEAGTSRKRRQPKGGTTSQSQEKVAPDKKGKGRSTDDQDDVPHEEATAPSTPVARRAAAAISSTRVPSALDVLAEQAAQERRPAVGSVPSEQRRSASPPRTERSNSQATEREDADLQSPPVPPSALKSGRARTSSPSSRRSPRVETRSPNQNSARNGDAVDTGQSNALDAARPGSTSPAQRVHSERPASGASSSTRSAHSAPPLSIEVISVSATVRESALGGHLV
ncbi:hypothetical protein OBBRIDRAFT_793731 [Obba rivulosa]|uniref:Uncharacterized protein n=1 Tax=Obba rivulosa TaxID=1052685 RepID=A0A8E2ASA3_9APHY|nr:hypothetical protein OBBRIDRAFT_793731 [Obba rivulosa]